MSSDFSDLRTLLIPKGRPRVMNYGFRVTDTFTKSLAGMVPVTVAVTVTMPPEGVPFEKLTVVPSPSAA